MFGVQFARKDGFDHGRRLGEPWNSPWYSWQGTGLWYGSGSFRMLEVAHMWERGAYLSQRLHRLAPENLDSYVLLVDDHVFCQKIGKTNLANIAGVGIELYSD